MAYERYEHKSSAELQREVAEERARIDAKLTEIQAKLDPSRIADNLLNSRMVGDMVNATARNSAEFAGGLGKTIAANPLPAALLGISLAWLMAGPRPSMNGAHRPSYPDTTPYRTIDGDSLKRISHARDDTGEWFSEFADQTGKTYRAKSNEAGHRIGDFMDSAGEAVSGFVDRSGQAVTRFTDEAGSMIDDAAGWARGAANAVAGAVGGIAHSAGKVGSAMAETASGVAGSAGDIGSSLQDSASRASKEAVRLVEEQPLVAAAIAFAVGAAIAAALPRTRHEDEWIGEFSDQARSEAGQMASSLYEDGKEKVSELYEEVVDEVGEVYDETKKKVSRSVKRDGQSDGIRH